MNRLYYGDNLEVLRGFGGESVDLLYLDAPFNSHADGEWTGSYDPKADSKL